MKFDSDDPMHDILTDFMARGGEADRFLKAMYEVARRLRLIPFEQVMENRENRRMENRDGKLDDETRFKRNLKCFRGLFNKSMWLIECLTFVCNGEWAAL